MNEIFNDFKLGKKYADQNDDMKTNCQKVLNGKKRKMPTHPHTHIQLHAKKCKQCVR